MTTPLLSVENLVVEYPVADGVFRAVDSVSFAVDKGKTLAVVGESGCGKSTIAKSIVRLLTPTSGRIVVDGTDIAGLSEKSLRPFRSRVQMVFQDPYGSLDPHLTAVDIVGEPLRLKGIRRKSDRARKAARLIDQVGLPSTALNRRPVEFSGGQRQRIGIARALASGPEILVCDEATSALDVSVQAQVLNLLREIQQDTGLTYVFISHNLGVVREISETVVVMSKGRIVEGGDTEEVLARPKEPYTRALRAAALDPATMVGIKPRHIVSRLSTPSVGAPV
ncbi:MAG: ATP-binding cassette domain-containing protein [Rhodococcus fascians]|uniref:ATP-binding cassette domain-containing protein n=1 Tax=Nocardiaceae TaxID=85025 RepID=UPI000363CE71|nr:MULTISPECIES: ATP-binding cassette domain-containing protein [Rhodococcus]OZC50651.1 ABC transporter ATP-binding protein [Rhodococcus sp. 06-621-2]OZD09009.1 ABC transporter ATP-binding protein [Rhodococcus sp. 06-156-4C]OZD12945.1 ABC transporter ATP-binding protein [Rhodococcus sp. 06-156-3C]OZD27978.1 ABC transporter ATP-binding protein [Rhodococcus sp. 06-156-4a]OZD32465.1 ABC transporter ATP-binding protein [Rhodococcus sp. 06-156-3b]